MFFFSFFFSIWRLLNCTGFEYINDRSNLLITGSFRFKGGKSLRIETRASRQGGTKKKGKGTWVKDSLFLSSLRPATSTCTRMEQSSQRAEVSPAIEKYKSRSGKKKEREKKERGKNGNFYILVERSFPSFNFRFRQLKNPACTQHSYNTLTRTHRLHFSNPPPPGSHPLPLNAITTNKNTHFPRTLIRRNQSKHVAGNIHRVPGLSVFFFFFHPCLVSPVFSPTPGWRDARRAGVRW